MSQGEERTNEDRRTAIAMKVSIANTLVNVALALIAAEALIAAFVLDKREHVSWFYLFGAIALALLTGSVVMGGKGIASVYQRGFIGKWELEDDGQFDYQAVLCLAGAVLVALASVCGTPKQEQSEAVALRIRELTATQQEIKGELTQLRKDYSAAQAHVEVSGARRSMRRGKVRQKK